MDPGQQGFDRRAWGTALWWEAELRLYTDGLFQAAEHWLEAIVDSMPACPRTMSLWLWAINSVSGISWCAWANLRSRGISHRLAMLGAMCTCRLLTALCAGLSLQPRLPTA
jgi:hypothetical protein